MAYEGTGQRGVKKKDCAVCESVLTGKFQINPSNCAYNGLESRVMLACYFLDHPRSFGHSVLAILRRCPVLRLGFFK